MKSEFAEMFERMVVREAVLQKDHRGDLFMSSLRSDVIKPSRFNDPNWVGLGRVRVTRLGDKAVLARTICGLLHAWLARVSAALHVLSKPRIQGHLVVFESNLHGVNYAE